MNAWLSTLRRHRSLTADEARRRRGRRRVAAYVGFLAVLGFTLSLRSALAETRRMTYQLGRDLSTLSDLLTERARVDINGEHLWAASALSGDAVGAILDRFEASCREGGAGEGTWGRRVGGGRPSVRDLVDVSDARRPAIRFGVLRSEDDDEGAVMCFPSDAKSAFADRLDAFVKSQDLGELGRMRYAYVRRERGTSHVLTLWTEDHLRLDRLVGASDEEPGSDNPDLPRPVRSRRTVSVAVGGTPYGARGYLSLATPAEVLEHYGQEMAHRGWGAVGTLDDGIQGFIKEGSLVTVATKVTERGTVVGIAEMGAEPEVAPTATAVVDGM